MQKYKVTIAKHESTPREAKRDLHALYMHCTSRTLELLTMKVSGADHGADP